MTMWQGALEKIDDYRWRIPTSHKQGMRVPGLVYADQKMLEQIKSEQALEQARVQKVIGHSLDAAVAIVVSPELSELIQGYASELKSIFIVSKVELVENLSGESYEAEGIPGMRIWITAAPGVKCERCWCYDEEIGGDTAHPTICPKCLKAVK